VIPFTVRCLRVGAIAGASAMIGVSGLVIPGCASDASSDGAGAGGRATVPRGTGGRVNGAGGESTLLPADAAPESGVAQDGSAANGTGGSQAAAIGVSAKCLTCLAQDVSCGAVALTNCKVTPTCGGCLTDLKSKGAGSGCRETPLLSAMGVCADQDCPDECDAERASVWMP
jgi:hypothetical protein